MPEPPRRVPLFERPGGAIPARVIFELARGVDVPYQDGVGEDLAKLGIGTADEWRALSPDSKGVATRRVFRTLAEKAIIELEDRARARNSSYDWGRLRRFFVADVGDAKVGLEELARRLRGIKGVERAWVEEIGPPPMVLAAANPRWKASQTVPGQGYLGQAPVGIDAEYAWSHPGGDGAGMVFIDVEEGWTLDHKDLVGNGSILVGGLNALACCGHGTAVLGVVCATDENDIGGVGIVPNLNSADVSSTVSKLGPAPQGQPPTPLTLHIADAIATAAERLSPGHVLLVEAQVFGPDKRLCPVELHDDKRAAIRCAVDAGIVVVEAGGNGDEATQGIDFDTYKNDNGDLVLAQGKPGFEDSGAILVSAAASDTRVRMPWAPYGVRVDCWAWGDGIDTSHSVPTQTGPTKDNYRQDFCGTSGSAAIVAGAVLALQGVAKAWTGSPLTPAQVRTTLRNAAAGTAAAVPVPEEGAPPPPPSGPIGRMPDLRAILDTMLHFPRILVRDTPQDDGTPHQGVVDASPDILVGPAAGGASPAPAAASAPPKVVRGVDHSIRVVVRNLGGAAASGVVVDVFETSPAQLVQSVHWTFVGTANVPNVPVGGAPVTSAAIPWPAGKLPAAGPRLLVAALGTATTPPVVPPDLVKESNFLHLVRTTSLLAARSVVVVNAPDLEP